MNDLSSKKANDLVILFSGGADSVLMLKIATDIGRIPLAVMVDYGQLHYKELDFAKKFLEKNDIENMTISITGYNVNSGLTGNGIKGTYEGVSPYNVPGRNSIFLSIAAGIAESRGISEVWIGANQADYDHLFPDCTQEYIGRMSKVFEISGSKPIKIYAPLLGHSKDLITLLLKSYNINPEEIYSGYGNL